MGGGHGGDVWEADGIWKEIDGGVALLNDIEPSIGQQLMTEVRQIAFCSLSQSLQGRAGLFFSNFRHFDSDHALTLCVMWIAR